MLYGILLALCAGGWVLLLLLRETGHLSVRRGAGAAYARRMAAERGLRGPWGGPPGGPGPADDDPGPGLPPRPSAAARGRG